MNREPVEKLTGSEEVDPYSFPKESISSGTPLSCLVTTGVRFLISTNCFVFAVGYCGSGLDRSTAGTQPIDNLESVVPALPLVIISAWLCLSPMRHTKSLLLFFIGCMLLIGNSLLLLFVVYLFVQI